MDFPIENGRSFQFVFCKRSQLWFDSGEKLPMLGTMDLQLSCSDPGPKELQQLQPWPAVSANLPGCTRWQNHLKIGDRVHWVHWTEEDWWYWWILMDIIPFILWWIVILGMSWDRVVWESNLPATATIQKWWSCDGSNVLNTVHRMVNGRNDRSDPT